MDIGALHFIRPHWLWAIPLCIALPWAWRHLRKASGDWEAICDPHLLKWLSVGDARQRSGKLGTVFAALVLLVSILALSGPSLHRLPDVSYSASDARVIVLDLSASMMAQDLKPNRLTRARYRLSDILLDSVEGQVGMVAYAGDAYVVSPLTNDTNTIANMLPALRPDVIPVAGSRADRAMELAAELLQRSGATQGEILLVTDDAEPGDADLAARLASDGIVTSVLAVGTRDGAPIPSGNGFVSDAQGNVVIARVGLDRLKAVADAGNGRLTLLSNAAASDMPWRAGEGTEFSLRDDGASERWRDLGPWLVLLLLPLVAAGFRRGLLFLLPLLVVPGLTISPVAQAGVWDDLWQRRDQQAQQALRDERPDQAASLARDPGISGEAWYRTGDFQRAAQHWQQLQDADAHYNRANAMALAGDLEGALTAYDQALGLQPEMDDALFNKALVEQLKQQQEQEQQEQDQEGEGEQQEGDPQDSEQQGEQQQEDGEQQEGEQQESEAQQQEGESREEQLAQAWTEEDQQAMEQWLRRIPDDPGGLLRRKFRSEHQRRGAPQDEKKTW